MSKKPLLLWLTLAILTTNVISNKHNFLTTRNKNDINLRQLKQDLYNEKLFDRDISDILDEKYNDSFLTVESTLNEVEIYIKGKISKVNPSLEIEVINFQNLNEGDNSLELKITKAEFNKIIKIDLVNVRLSISDRLKRIQKFILENDLDESTLTTASSYRDVLDLIIPKIMEIDNEAKVSVDEIQQKLDEGDNFIDLIININQAKIIVPIKVNNVQLSNFERLKNAYENFNGKKYENTLNLTVSSDIKIIWDFVIAEINEFDPLIVVTPLMENQELKVGDNSLYLKLSIDDQERIIQVVFQNIELSPKQELEALANQIAAKNFDGSKLTTKNTVLDLFKLLEIELLKINPEFVIELNAKADVNQNLIFNKNMLDIVVKLKDESRNLKVTFENVCMATQDMLKEIVKELQEKVTQTVNLNIDNTQKDAIDKIMPLLKAINPQAKLKLSKDFESNKNLIEGQNEIQFEIEIENEIIPVNIKLNNVRSLNFWIIQDFKKALQDEKNNLFVDLNTLNTKTQAFNKIVDFAKSFNSDIKLTLTDKKKATLLLETANSVTFKIKVNNLEEEFDFMIDKIKLSQYHLNLKLIMLLKNVEGSSLTTNNFMFETLPLINDVIAELAKEYDFTIRLYYEAIYKKTKLVVNTNIIIIEKIANNKETPKKILLSAIVKNVKKK